ncbi:MAG TPA: GNAT family N-acetyltransferase [Candidatus Bathyarchaeia archaeon]|nr:GNAT family N-acetyltransferase [Candidatus Bathyarchaeia archaeon]
MELKYKRLNESFELSNLDFTDKDGEDYENVQQFIRKYALKHQERNLGITRVIVSKGNPIGYFTISTSNIQKDSIDKNVRPFTRTTRIFPAMIIEYFGIDKNMRDQGIGSKVLKWIIGFGRKNLSRNVGCRYVILFAKRAIQFYAKNGFKISEIKGNDDKDSFYLMYRDLFPECVKLDKNSIGPNTT